MLAHLLFIATAILPGTMTTEAQGNIYLSNLGEVSAGIYNLGAGLSMAQPFQSGSNTAGYDLNSIQILMGAEDSSANNFSLLLCADNAGLPGNTLTALNGSANPINSGVYTYTASGLTLSPSTVYWIVATTEAPAISFYHWEIASSANYTASDGWSLNSEIPYGYIVSSAGSYTGNGLDPMQFAVEATPVPEPGVPILAGVGLVAIFLKRQKCLAIAKHFSLFKKHF